MNKLIPTKLIEVNVMSNMLVSIHDYNIRITCNPDQLITPENALDLARVLCEATDQINDEKAFDAKCNAILAALTPIQRKLLEEKLNTVKETSQ